MNLRISHGTCYFRNENRKGPNEGVSSGPGVVRNCVPRLVDFNLFLISARVNGTAPRRQYFRFRMSHSARARKTRRSASSGITRQTRCPLHARDGCTGFNSSHLVSVSCEALRDRGSRGQSYRSRYGSRRGYLRRSSASHSNSR